jgi:hypothetical protein
MRVSGTGACAAQAEEQYGPDAEGDAVAQEAEEVGGRGEGFK